MNTRGNRTTFVAGLLSLSVTACLSSPDGHVEGESALGAQDGADDDKAPLGFGIEPDAPDGLAVLHIANTYSVADLVAVGLTTRVAKNIYNKRQGSGPFASLVALDKVPYVGDKVFLALRWHATINNHYPTSLRVPTVTDDGQALPAVVNDALTGAGFAPLAPHVWINADQYYSGLLADWAQLFDEAGLGEEVYPLAYASLEDFAASAKLAGAPAPCWLGNPWLVADLLWSQNDGMLTDDYRVWAWRVGNKTQVLGTPWGHDLSDYTAWRDYDRASNAVAIVSSSSDDHVRIESIPACRNPK